MAWLARLDARAKRWPKPARATYISARWLLIGLGAYAVIGLAVIEIRERRVGLGTGVLSVVVLGTIKGLIVGSQRPR